MNAPSPVIRIFGLALLALLSTFWPETALAKQVCRDGHAPTARFEIASDNTVIDRKNRLQWMRCMVGNSGTLCDKGSPQRFTAIQALDFVVQFNRGPGHAGKTDWRLPTVRELKTLVSGGCVNPVIDLRAFPNSLPSQLWSADIDGGIAGFVDFRDGYSGQDDINLPNPVRLVRDFDKPHRRR